MKKRLTSLFLALCLVMTMLPGTVWAKESDSYVTIVEDCIKNSWFYSLAESQRDDYRGMLLDIDKDGQDELILRYKDKLSNYYKYDIWSMQGGKPICKLEMSELSSGGFLDGQIVSLDEKDYITFRVIFAGSQFSNIDWQFYLISDGSYLKEYTLSCSENYRDGDGDGYYTINEKACAPAVLDKFKSSLENGYTIPVKTEGLVLDDLLQLLREKASAPAENGYISVINEKIDKVLNYGNSLATGVGTLFDVDNNGMDELIMLYDTKAPTRDTDFFAPICVYSIYTMSDNTPVALVEQEELFANAGGPSGEISIVEIDGKYYVAAGSETGETSGTHMTRVGNWILYEIVGSNIKKATEIEYKYYYNDEKGTYYYNESYAIINGEKRDYRQLEDWVDGLNRIITMNAYDPLKSDSVMPLAGLREYIKSNYTATDSNIDSTHTPISDEAVLRAKLLSKDYTFEFYQKWKSPVQVMAEQLDPLPSATWYVVENYIDIYYGVINSGVASQNSFAKATAVEFYEYLLFKLLDSKEFNYLSLTDPFGLVDDLSGGAVDGQFMEKLVAAGFKSGTKITDGNKKKLKKLCVDMCGTDSITDIGALDYFLVTGKTVDKFVSEFFKYYALTSVSDARAEAIRLIGQNAQSSALRTAANNVCDSIARVKDLGMVYCLDRGAEESMSEMTTWIMDKMVDAMCELHPASKVWKATVDWTTFAMDTIFLTDDISTDTMYILGMTNVEKALLAAINQAETAFLEDETLENAERYLALGETLKRGLMVGCDLCVKLVDHTERGDLNWHGILEVLNMTPNKKADFGTALKWMFGDPDSKYADLRNSLESIKKNIEIADFFQGSVSALDLLQDPNSVTPSTWAKAEVDKAIGYGILPEWVRTNYQSNVTRLEFCALLEFMIEGKTGKTVYQLADEFTEANGGQLKAPFDDALYMEANDIALLGIINGVGDNKFNPLGEITRQEAAIMLYRTADVLSYDTSSAPADHTGVASWAIQGVDFVITKGIMNGTGNGFEPNGKYTKEQAILTLVRFFEYVE